MLRICGVVTLARNKTVKTGSVDQLLVSLVNSGEQHKNNALYQTINQLITTLSTIKDDIYSKISALETKLDNSGFIVIDRNSGFPNAKALQDVILIGLRANQPLAKSVVIGTLYYVTDETLTERSDGDAWKSYKDV